VCERTVDYTCVFPTLCELAGLPLPARLDGSSIVPLLRNPTTAWNLPAISTHGFNNHTVRSEGWRYIRYADGGEELYNTRADPLEYTNLARLADFTSRKAELAKFLPEHNAKELPSRRQARNNKRAR
jgi:arylsulfatase A-like enzyme